jgi:leucyl-tRNA synthetase
MIFNHTAIFPRDLWPRGIFVNGSVLMEGQKMSKSLKNIIPLIEAVEEFGADPLRLSLMATAEPIKDADFSRSLAKSMRETLERLHERVGEAAEHPGEPSGLRDIDQWMLSRLQRHIAEATEAMEELRVRRAIHAILYNMNQDLDWYLRRVAPSGDERAETIQYVLRRVVEAQVRMLAPFTPHLCEELWEILSGEGFVSTASWPESVEEEVRPDLEEEESIIRACLEDIQHILRVTGIRPRHIHLYTATSWKWKVYLKALELARRGELEVGTLIKECFRDEELRVRPREVSEFARGMVEDVVKTPEERIKTRLEMGVVNELRVLQDAADFLRAEFGCEVSICGESDPWIKDPEGRAKRAKPYRPAIYIE